MSYLTSVLADLPTRYYRFDGVSGDLVDQGSQGIDMQVTGTPTYSVDGLLNTDPNDAIDFDGASHFQSSTAVHWDNVDDDVTFEFLLNRASAPGTAECIFEQYDTGSTLGGAIVYISALGQIELAGKTIASATYRRNYTDLDYCDGQTHHVVITVTSNVVEIWVDGDSVAMTNSNFTGTIYYNTPCNIGANRHAATTPTNYYNGIIDEVAIYSYALLTGRISAHYADVGLTGASGSYEQMIVDEGVWCFLPLTDDDVADPFINLGNGTVPPVGTRGGNIHSGKNSLIAGGEGSSANLDGVGDYVELTTATCHVSGSNNFTVEIWFKTYDSGMQIIVDKRTSTRGYLIGINSGQISMYQDGGSTVDTITSNHTNLDNGKPHHLVCKYRRDSAQDSEIWIDGVLDKSETFNSGSRSGTLVSSALLRIGDNVPTSGWGNFTGKFQYFAWYNYLLPAGAIQRHYQYGDNLSVLDDYCTVLLQSPGPDQSTTLEDTSLYGHSPTGDAVHDNGVVYESSSNEYWQGFTALKFDGTNHIKVPWSGNWNFGNGDFTLECFLYIRSDTSAEQTIMAQWDDTLTNGKAWKITYTHSTGTWKFVYTTDGSTELTHSFVDALTLGRMYQFAMERMGTTLHFYKNGIFDVANNYTISTATIYSNTVPLYIGAVYDTTSVNYLEELDGYMAEILVCDGLARYGHTTYPYRKVPYVDFTPDLGSYMDLIIADDPWLYFPLNEEVENYFGAVNYGITPTFSTGVWSGTNPRGIETSLIPTESGRAVSFDSTNQCISDSQTGAALSGVDLVFECWFSTTDTGQKMLVDKRSGSTGFFVGIADGTITYYQGSSGSNQEVDSLGSTYNNGATYHLVVVADRGGGGDCTIYINGAVDNAVELVSGNGHLTSTARVSLAHSFGSSSWTNWTGTMDHAALYTGGTTLTSAQVYNHWLAGLEAGLGGLLAIMLGCNF